MSTARRRWRVIGHHMEATRRFKSASRRSSREDPKNNRLMQLVDLLAKDQEREKELAEEAKKRPSIPGYKAVRREDVSGEHGGELWLAEKVAGYSAVSSGTPTGIRAWVELLNQQQEPYNLANLQRELDVRSLLDHENVLMVDDFIDTPSCLALVYESFEGQCTDADDELKLRSLKDLIPSGGMREEEARKWFRAMLVAIDYCHASGFVHRNLSVEHMYVVNDVLKVSGFYQASAFDHCVVVHTVEKCCDWPLAAPEVLNGHECSGVEPDIWSLGACLYQLLTGHLPFEGVDPSLFFKGDDPKFEPTPYDDANRLLSKLLCPEPVERARRAEIRRHTWTKGDISGTILPHFPVYVSGITPTNIDYAIVEQIVDLGLDRTEVLRELFEEARAEACVIYGLIRAQHAEEEGRDVASNASKQYTPLHQRGRPGERTIAAAATATMPGGRRTLSDDVRPLPPGNFRRKKQRPLKGLEPSRFDSLPALSTSQPVFGVETTLTVPSPPVAPISGRKPSRSPRSPTDISPPPSRHPPVRRSMKRSASWSTLQDKEKQQQQASAWVNALPSPPSQGSKRAGPPRSDGGLPTSHPQQQRRRADDPTRPAATKQDNAASIHRLGYRKVSENDLWGTRSLSDLPVAPLRRSSSFRRTTKPADKSKHATP